MITKNPHSRLLSHVDPFTSVEAASVDCARAGGATEGRTGPNALVAGVQSTKCGIRPGLVYQAYRNEGKIAASCASMPSRWGNADTTHKPAEHGTRQLVPARKRGRARPIVSRDDQTVRR